MVLIIKDIPCSRALLTRFTLEKKMILPSYHRLKENFLQQFINSSRTKVLSILRKNIKGEKELGLAEALLIGYKDDLDKTLVQSYSNTGVVHVIAISGLHLGLIYWLLTLFFKPIQKRKLRWLRPILFSLAYGYLVY